MFVFVRLLNLHAELTVLTRTLSLFGLVNRTVTKAGFYKLRQWMLTPLVNAARINERLDAVAFFMQPENEEIRTQLVRLDDSCIAHALTRA